MDQRRDDRLRPLRAGPLQPDRASGSRRSPRCASRGTPTGSCSPTTPPATWTSSPARPPRHALAQAAPNWHYEHIQRTTCSPRCASRGERRAAHHDAGRQPAAVLLVSRRTPSTPGARAVRHDGHHPRRRRHRALRPTCRRRWWRCCGRRSSAAPTPRRWSRSAASASDVPAAVGPRGPGRRRAASPPASPAATGWPSCCRPGLDWVLGFLGTLLAGAVAVPVNTRFAAPEIEYVLTDSGAAAVLRAGSPLPDGHPARPGGPRPRRPRRDLLHQRHHRPSPRARAPPTSNFLSNVETAIRVHRHRPRRRADAAQPRLGAAVPRHRLQLQLLVQLGAGRDDGGAAGVRGGRVPAHDRRGAHRHAGLRPRDLRADAGPRRPRRRPLRRPPRRPTAARRSRPTWSAGSRSASRRPGSATGSVSPRPPRSPRSCPTSGRSSTPTPWASPRRWSTSR